MWEHQHTGRWNLELFSRKKVSRKSSKHHRCPPMLCLRYSNYCGPPGQAVNKSLHSSPPGPSSRVSWRPCTHFLPLTPPTLPLLLEVSTSLLKWKDMVPGQWIDSFVLHSRSLLTEVNSILQSSVCHLGVVFVCLFVFYFEKNKASKLQNGRQRFYQLSDVKVFWIRVVNRKLQGLRFLFTCLPLEW